MRGSGPRLSMWATPPLEVSEPGSNIPGSFVPQSVLGFMLAEAQFPRNALLETVWKIARGLVERGLWQHKMTK